MQERESKKPNSRRSKTAWLALLLIPLAFFLPICGESLKRTIVGPDKCCCASCTDPTYRAKVERGQSLRWLANILIGGGILLGIMSLTLATYILYRYAVADIDNRQAKFITQIAIGIPIAALAALLLLTAFIFVFKNKEYYNISAEPPQDHIYISILSI